MGIASSACEHHMNVTVHCVASTPDCREHVWFVESAVVCVNRQMNAFLNE